MTLILKSRVIIHASIVGTSDTREVITRKKVFQESQVKISGTLWKLRERDKNIGTRRKK